MANITGNPIVGGIDLYSSSATPITDVGSLIFGDNGKAYRYALAGEALVVGNVLQSSVVDTQFDDMAVAANVAIGQNQIVLTNGTTAVTAGQFVGGTVEFSVTPHLGGEYTIIGHSTATNGSSWTLTLDRPLRVAITSAATKATVRRSPWSGSIQLPTTQTGTPVGVAIYAIPSGEYGWVQTKGVAAVLSDNSTFAVGSCLSNSVAAAGAVGVFVAGTARSLIGLAMRAAASGKTIPVQLMLD